MTETLTGKRREILDFIAAQVRERGYPPSVREIGLAVGLASTSTVQAHLNTLQKQGYLRRDPTKPRALEVRYDATSGAAIERRPTRHVPLVGDIAAGTNVLAAENIEELLPLPEDFTGRWQRVHAAGPGRLDDRSGHPGRGLRGGAPATRGQHRRRRGRRDTRRGGDGQDVTPGVGTTLPCSRPTQTGSPWSSPPTK